MRQVLNFILHLMLLMVVLSEINSIWVGIAHKAQYQAVFPGAAGALYYLAQATSFAAGGNCILIWRRKRWAVWLNILIGVWSITLIEILHGPRINELIVLAASTVTTVLPLVVWRSGKT